MLLLVQSLLSWHGVPWYRLRLLVWVHALSLVNVSNVSKKLNCFVSQHRINYFDD